MTGAPPPPPPPPDPNQSHGVPPPPPPPGGPAPVAATSPDRNGLAVASMVLGIISVPMCFLFVPSVLALVLGIIALSQISSNPGQSGRGQAIAGIVLGGVSLAAVVVLILLGSAFEVESSMLAVL